MAADVLRINICATFELCASCQGMWFKSATTPSAKTLIFHSYITEILYLGSIALAAKTYVKPVSDSVSWKKGWL
jgi:hypothetical protein